MQESVRLYMTWPFVGLLYMGCSDADHQFLTFDSHLQLRSAQCLTTCVFYTCSAYAECGYRTRNASTGLPRSLREQYTAFVAMAFSLSFAIHTRSRRGVALSNGRVASEL